MKTRVLIADDEPLARAKLRRLLNTDSSVEIVGEAGDGEAAATQILELRPDIVFLDIHMPELNGFEALDASREYRPIVIFVTAYDEFAVRAFEAQAFDYLLKPYDAERLRDSFSRARAKLADQDVGRRLKDVLSRLEDSRSRRTERLMIRDKGRIVFVNTVDISHIEAAGNYAKVHVGKTTHLMRETLATLGARLEGEDFVRIHRSCILNLGFIKELQPWFGGDYIVQLHDGTRLTVSRTYRDRLFERLGQAPPES